MNPIPLVDLSRQHAPLLEEIVAALSRVVSAGNFILGREVADFEKAFAAYCGCRFGVGVASGTDALYLALRAAGVGPGDAVVTTANTFIATALAVTYAGAVPFLTDADEESFNLTPALLTDALERAARRGLRVKAVIPVHLFGRPCEMEGIMEVAARGGIAVVEDACQAHGAIVPFRGARKRAGCIGVAGCFSFYPGKNLGGLGDGGLVVTDDEAMAGRLRLLREYGSPRKYVHLMKGVNSRLDTLQAAALAVKLPRLEGWNDARVRLAALYRERISSDPSLARRVVLPTAPRAGTHVYHLFVVRVPDRDGVLSRMQKHQVFAGIHYPIPIHRQEAYADLLLGPGSLPVVERLAGEILSLPLFPGMTGEEVVRVTDALRESLPA